MRGPFGPMVTIAAGGRARTPSAKALQSSPRSWPPTRIATRRPAKTSSAARLACGVVSFHGNLQGYQPADGPIRTPVLVLHGADDSSVPPEHVEAFTREMREGGADWQLVSFGGARHCFSQPENADGPPDSNCRYDERTARRAFAMMRGFFRERFGP